MYGNVCVAMAALVDGVKRFGLRYADAAAEAAAAEVLGYVHNQDIISITSLATTGSSTAPGHARMRSCNSQDMGGGSLDALSSSSFGMLSMDEAERDATMLRAAKLLWADEAIQGAYARAAELQLLDSCSYFMRHLDRLLAPGYVPSEEDMLHLRARTMGINEAEFEIRKATFRVTDVAGQVGMRRKWMHLFEGVTAVIFMAGVSEFDQVLREDNRTNRLEDSLQLFGQMVSNEFLRKSHFVVFLNKVDLLEKKLKKTSLERLLQFIPTYPHDKVTLDLVTKHIRRLFEVCLCACVCVCGGGGDLGLRSLFRCS